MKWGVGSNSRSQHHRGDDDMKNEEREGTGRLGETCSVQNVSYIYGPGVRMSLAHEVVICGRIESHERKMIATSDQQLVIRVTFHLKRGNHCLFPPKPRELPDKRTDVQIVDL